MSRQFEVCSSSHSANRKSMAAPVLFALFLMPSSMAQSTDYPGDPAGVAFGRGFSNQIESSIFQNIDSIDNFSGSLSLTIHIGQSYAAGGALSYGFIAYYNSNISDRKLRLYHQPGEPEVGVPVDIPSPYANAGVGFAVHLGRFFPPTDLDVYHDLPAAERDRLPPISDAWRYLSPDGSIHHFWDTLHGENNPHPNVRYTRDGSYMRLKVVSATAVTVEMPGGQVHRFEKGVWPDASFNRDEWRLKSIEDRSGNVIALYYFAGRWEVGDSYGRRQKVFYGSDPWYGGRVARIELTAFGGATAVFRFQYTTRQFRHVTDDGTTSQLFTVGQLQTLTREDGAKYVFQSLDLGLVSPIVQAQLPSGGSIEWEYDSFMMPNAYECDPNFEPADNMQLGVERRTAKDASGAPLQVTRYLRQTNLSPGIPAIPLCFQVEGQKPKAELVSARLQEYADDKSRLSLFYYSVWPIPRNLWDTKDTGHQGEDFGLPFSKDRPKDGDRFLSNQEYDCPFGESTAPTGSPLSLASKCTRMRSTFVKYEKDYSECFQTPDWECLDVNAIVRRDRTVFHDDGGLAARNDRNEYDGFGHYRNVLERGSVSSKDSRDLRIFYNASRGKLVLDSQGRIGPSSTWTNYPVEDPWILTRLFEKRSTVGNATFYDLACFWPDTPLLRYVRTRSNTSGGGLTDSPNDLLREYTYSAGLTTSVRYYGGDVANNLQDVNGCIVPTPPVPERTLVSTYDKGVLKTAKYQGSTTKLVDVQTIDANTGLPVKVWDETRNLVATAVYDSSGRLTSSTNNTGVVTTFVYNLPGVNGYTGDVPRTAITTKLGGSIVAKNVSDFDALGRVTSSETLYKHGTLRTEYVYAPDGSLAKRTVPQKTSVFNPNYRTEFEYEVFGRPAKITRPDGRIATFSYSGVGRRRSTVGVGTIETSTGVDEQGSTTTLDFDRRGNVVKATTPGLGTTEYSYNAIDQLVEAKRGIQTRSFHYDGRGFRLSESQPEFGTRSYGFYDTLGLYGQVLRNGGQLLRFSYDADGRLTSVQRDIGNNPSNPTLVPHAMFEYGAVGVDNGRLVHSERYNDINPENTFGYLNEDDEIVVSYDYSYGLHASPTSRTVSVVRQDTSAEFGRFRQSWTYDGLGRPRTIVYPRCAAGLCTDPARTVTLEYADGGRLSRVIAGGAMGANFTYHVNGALCQVRHNNGKWDVYGIGANRTSLPSSLSLAGGLLNLGAFRYDSSGNITRLGGDKFIYDLAGRIVKASIPGGPANDFETFVYDRYDNIEEMGWDPQIDASTNRIVGPVFDYNNSGYLLRAGPWRFKYDSNGKTESNAVDLQGEGDQACAFSTGSGECWFFWYGADGKRVATVKVNVDRSVDFRWTLRDLDGSILRSFDGAASLPNGQLRATRDFVRGAGRPIAFKDLVANRTGHLHVDHLGSVRAITDGAGALAAYRHFRAFGLERNGSGTEAETLEFSGWTGAESNLGLPFVFNLGARTYSSPHARFTTPDVVNDGWNLYAYARNNPLKRVDPSGTTSECHDIAGPTAGRNADEGQCQDDLPVFEETIDVVDTPLEITEEDVDGIFGASPWGHSLFDVLKEGGSFPEPTPLGEMSDFELRLELGAARHDALNRIKRDRFFEVDLWDTKEAIGRYNLAVAELQRRVDEAKGFEPIHNEEFPEWHHLHIPDNEMQQGPRLPPGEAARLENDLDRALRTSEFIRNQQLKGNRVWEEQFRRNLREWD